MAFRQRVEALKAPEPDGQAAVCKTAEAGSTPAGASQRLPRRSPPVVHPHRPKSSTWPSASVAANSWHPYALATSGPSPRRRLLPLYEIDEFPSAEIGDQ